MNYSYWEHKEWFTGNDFVIVGSGIVGLTCAINLKERFPKANVLILEKGVLPQGASTKNAGFACFGSASELLSDLKNHSEEEVFTLVKKRWEGLLTLRSLLGDKKIDYQQNHGYELFVESEKFEECSNSIGDLNQLLFPIFRENVFAVTADKFKFKNCIKTQIVNHFEGQIDTGKMVAELLIIAQKKGIKILNNTMVQSFSEDLNHVKIQTNQGEFMTSKLCFATNGFSKELFHECVQPARAQVLITSPIKDLHIKGVFHLDEGYYYFRNIHNRILLGGGRNLDFKTEETTRFGQTKRIQQKLETLLKTIVLPEKDFEIDHRWSGIMGVGNQKNPIVKQLSDHVFCGVRLGGMGIAIGSLVGKELAMLIID
ncbi:MAG: L-2-hydroxyglutarate oxidase LhgO [Flavobacterium sp. SCGC AAA160-P02]|nr:MAG: L-2-hydroxyglutarate oxidase LhgO [Flavobacterium sp. SCGC AAA160-P02]